MPAKDDVVVSLHPDPLLLLHHFLGLYFCRNALELKIITHERIEAVMSEQDVMRRLVERLKIQRASSIQWSYSRGREDGLKWAINEADYSALVRLVQGNLSANDCVDYYSEEYYDKPRADAELALEIYDDDAYLNGFEDAVLEIWEQVKGELQ